jgi:AcrR family transcriptional regulator
MRRDPRTLLDSSARERTVTAVPRPSLAGARRPQIVAAAARAIGEHGFDGVRLADVAREAGVSVGTVQHYFGSRQALVETTFRHFNEEAAERCRAVVAAAGSDPWDGLVALVDHVVAGNMRWNLWTELVSASMRRPELLPAMNDAYSAWRAPIAAVVAAGVADGAFHPGQPLDDVVDGLVGLIDGLGVQVQLGALAGARMRRILLDAIALVLGVGDRASLRSAV